MMPFQYQLLSYFDEAAARVPQHMAPVLRPLAEDFVLSMDIENGERVLDAGCGSGMVGGIIAHRGCTVTGIDFSRAMCRLAAKSIPIIQGDIQHLPFPSSSFDLVTASLAFNSTEPLRAMQEVHRVLTYGGRLALQEWGTNDTLSELVADTIAEYAVDDPPEDLRRRRQEQVDHHPWDDLETSDDIVDLLESADFTWVDLSVKTPNIWLQSARDFIDYKLAWPTRLAEVEAMTEEIRSLCLSDLAENVSAHAAANGRLCWQPNLVRIMAYKKD